MAKIVIKKRVELGFLGDDYSDSYLIFRSIPVVEYSDIIKKAEAANDNQESMTYIIETLEKYFLSGSFQKENVAKEDIKQFDGDTILKCFESLTGQVATEEGNTTLDPKSEKE